MFLETAVLLTQMTLASGICKDDDLFKNETVISIAGNGHPGTSDVDTHDAAFVLPAGIAVDGNGKIFVSDVAAQRIRVVDGSKVRTIAGGGSLDDSGQYVDGAFEDGPVLQSRFYHPSSLAIAPNGDIYVADTDNDAVRRISNGFVSTVIGKSQAPHTEEGSPDHVVLNRPLSLAIDDAGVVYIANERGLHILGKDHIIQTYREEIKPVYAVSVFGSGKTRSIFEITPFGIDFYDESTGFERHMRMTRFPMNDSNNIAAARSIGRPTSIVAINDHEAAFTDIQNGTVYLLDATDGRIDERVGSPYETQDGDFSFTLDGSANAARFNEPWGIAYDRSTHDLIVAEAGGRRIRRISGIMFLPEYAIREHNTNELHIAVMGNSFAYFDTNFRDSIEGQLELRLENLLQRCVVVDPIAIGSNIKNYASFIENYGSAYDLMVVQLNLYHLYDTFHIAPRLNHPPDPLTAVETVSEWEPGLSTLLRKLSEVTKKVGSQLLIAINPVSQELDSNDFLWNRFFIVYGKGALKPENRLQSLMVQSAKSSGSSVLDLFPSLESVSVDGTCALFGTANEHLSKCGRAVVARSIATVVASQFRNQSVPPPR